MMDTDVAKALVKVISIIGIIGGGLTILFSLFIMVLGPTVLITLFKDVLGSYAELFSSLMIFIGILLAISGIFGIIVATNLMKFREWARIATIIISALSAFQALMAVFYGGIVSLIINGTILYLLGFNEDIRKLFITQKS
jgi:hypothetical protein